MGTGPAKGRFWRLRDGRICVTQSDPYPSPSGTVIDIGVLTNERVERDGLPALKLERHTAVDVLSLGEEVDPRTLVPPGKVVDRKVEIDEQGRRHITFACEMPDFGAQGASIGKRG